jgi:hypothetical protein
MAALRAFRLDMCISPVSRQVELLRASASTGPCKYPIAFRGSTPSSSATNSRCVLVSLPLNVATPDAPVPLRRRFRLPSPEEAPVLPFHISSACPDSPTLPAYAITASRILWSRKLPVLKPQDTYYYDKHNGCQSRREELRGPLA